MPGKPPSIWGPRLWPYIHGFARLIDATADPALKRRRAEAYMRFMDLLQVTMPCGICRDSYKIFWGGNGTRGLMAAAVAQPPNPDDLAATVVAYALHDTVSTKLKKPTRPTCGATLADPVPGDDEQRLWEYLFVMGYNYNDNGEPEKRRHYREFMAALLNALRLFGYERTHAVLRRHYEQIVQAATQQEWVDALYWAYRAWAPRAMPESEVYRHFGICDRPT